jgi:protein-tyrosine phosphatase
MEERQRDHIRKTDPEAAPKVFTLNEYVGESGDIVDPYGSELDNYRKTYGIIEERILKLLNKLKNS